jgi:hypothetical protein
MDKPKTFTLEEAQSLVPVLKSLLKTAMDGKRVLEQVERESLELTQRIKVSGGYRVDIVKRARRMAERDKALQETKDALAEIDSIGVQVKDLDIGLLDFPCVVEGETILLCWKYGEDKLEYWHGLEEGFQGRKPIDERIRGAKKREKPN